MAPSRLMCERTSGQLRTPARQFPRSGGSPKWLLSLGYPLSMTAKEKLLRDVLDLDEAKAARARIVVSDDSAEEAEMAPLPKGWGETLTGEPMPNVAAAVRRSRDSH
jgi:hypothetical protein